VTWRPATIEDLFMPGVWATVAAWCEGNAKDLLWMREHGASGKRPHKQQPLFLAQSDWFPKGAWCCFGDLRRASDGVIEPWDFTAPITSDLNLDFLEVLLSTCPDRELVSHLRHGVDFKADLPLQTVLMPHLNSIAKKCRFYVSVKSTGCVVKGGRQPLACCRRSHVDYFRAAQWSVNTNPVARDGRSMRRLRTKRTTMPMASWLFRLTRLSSGTAAHRPTHAPMCK